MFYLLVFVLGLFVGSFLGVVIDRIPRNEQFSTGRSYCEFCGHTLGTLDLIPVLSYVFLGGRCRYCKAHLSPYYLAVELTTGILFVLTPLLITFTNSAYLSLFLVIICAFIILFFTDLKYGILPDKIVFPTILAVLLWLLLSHLPLPIHLLSAAGAMVVFLLIFILSKGKGMGFGDVKLAFLIGLLLGFPLTLISIYLAFLTGAVISIILILIGRKKLKGSTIPFGPFLVVATFLSIYFGEEIKNAAFKIFNIS